MTVIILSKQERNEYETNRLIESFASKGMLARACHPDKFDIIVDKDIRQGIKYEGKPIELPRLLLVRLGAGILPFQLAVIRHFEQAGVPCVNSSYAVEVVKDKLRTSQMLSRAGLAIPNTMLVRLPIDEKLVTDNVSKKSKLLELFNLNEQDTKKDVFTKLNYHLAKTNTVPAGSQLAFILLYKQYS